MQRTFEESDCGRDRPAPNLEARCMLDFVLMVFMALLWAGGFVASKLSVAAVPPETVAFLRFLIAGLIMAGLLRIYEPRSFQLERRDWWLVLALGATGIAGYNLFFFWGVRLSLASDGAMIIPTLNPLITLFAAALLLGESLTRRKLLGAAISLAGQTMIFWTLIRAAAADPHRLTGDLFYMGAAVLWSSYSILGRVASRRFTPMQATTLAMLTGAVLLAPPGLRAAVGSSGYTSSFWLQMLYIALGGTVGGFLLWNRGVHRLGASRAAVFLNLVPVSTLVLAYFILHERPAALQVAGVLLVLAGVYTAGTLPRDSRLAVPIPGKDRSA